MEGVRLGQQWEYVGAVYPEFGGFPIITSEDPVNQWIEDFLANPDNQLGYLMAKPEDERESGDEFDSSSSRRSANLLHGHFSSRNQLSRS